MKTRRPEPRSRDEKEPASALSAESSSAFPEGLLRQNRAVPRAGLACVKRMPAYLQLLRRLQAEGQEHVSGTVLAGVHHWEPVIVRKDLALTGATGKPRIGFRVSELITAIERFLGWDNQTKALLVGTGSLGTALLGYQGFQSIGIRLVGAFDIQPKLIGTWVHGRKVQPMSQLNAFARRGDIRLGILTVPEEAAQATADLMVQAGIKGIWNFTNRRLQLPVEVVSQKEDLAEGLAVLCRRLNQAMSTIPAK